MERIVILDFGGKEFVSFKIIKRLFLDSLFAKQFSSPGRFQPDLGQRRFLVGKSESVLWESKESKNSKDRDIVNRKKAITPSDSSYNLNVTVGILNFFSFRYLL